MAALSLARSMQGVARIWPKALWIKNLQFGTPMHRMRGWLLGMMSMALAAGGCAAGEHDAYVAEREEARPRTEQAAEPARLVSPADSAQARARVAAESVAVETAFRRVRRLRAREVAELRQDRNAEQVASAQRLGVRVSGEGEIERLVREGRLVALGDSTEYWILRDMDHSAPYVTPDTRAMLMDLGRRFHRRLDALGLPRYRLKVTSAIRTGASQEDLRRTNSYAARTVSAHQFGTTVDVSHERFAVPAAPRPTAGGVPAPASGAWEREVEMLEAVGKEHAKALQAELGRAIAELRAAGALHVMMENRQPVYHMTIARRFTSGSASR